MYTCIFCLYLKLFAIIYEISASTVMHFFESIPMLTVLVLVAKCSTNRQEKGVIKSIYLLLDTNYFIYAWSCYAGRVLNDPVLLLFFQVLSNCSITFSFKTLHTFDWTIFQTTLRLSAKVVNYFSDMRKYCRIIKKWKWSGNIFSGSIIRRENENTTIRKRWKRNEVSPYIMWTAVIRHEIENTTNGK